MLGFIYDEWLGENLMYMHWDLPLNLTLKWPGLFFQNVISVSDDGHSKCNIFLWNRPNTMNT